jgi:hypothetical protein
MSFPLVWVSSIESFAGQVLAEKKASGAEMKKLFILDL